MTVTMRDIARKAGVSVATVSNVLSGKPKASKEVADRVIEIARNLNYFDGRPSKISQSSTAKNIGLLVKQGVEGWDNPFYADIFHGIAAVLGERGYSMFYSSLRMGYRGQSQLREKMTNGETSGLLTVGRVEPEIIDEAYMRGIPVVSIDQADQRVDCVVSDNQRGAIEAVTYLISLGHRNIAFIGGPKEDSSFVERAWGYRLGLSEHGIEVDADSMMFMPLAEVEYGYDAMKSLLERYRGYTAVFCSNDPLACGVLKALSEYGLSVPSDISVVGFDDSKFAVATVPPLTTVRVDAVTMGIVGAKMLLRNMTESLSLDVSRTVLPVELVKRESCAPVRSL